MNWLKKFMLGRYGVDQLTWLLFGISIVLSVLSLFIKSQVFTIINIVILLVVIYRTFSKDIANRYEENMKFLNGWYSIKNKINNQVQRIKGLKHYKYFKCTNCKQKLRVPRGKGKISITCPKCKNVMVKKS